MPTKVSIKLNDRAINSISTNAMKGLIKMGFDIAAQARKNAPYVTGALRNTIRVNESSDGIVEVIAGGNYGGRSVPYAWKREQGPNRNSATEHYMENAKNTIMVGDYMKKYFGDITK